MKHIVTQEDLDLNPELVEEGVEVGDEIDLAEVEPSEEEMENAEEIQYEDLAEEDKEKVEEVIREEGEGGDLSVKI